MDKHQIPLNKHSKDFATVRTGGFYNFITFWSNFFRNSLKYLFSNCQYSLPISWFCAFLKPYGQKLFYVNSYTFFSKFTIHYLNVLEFCFLMNQCDKVFLFINSILKGPLFQNQPLL